MLFDEDTFGLASDGVGRFDDLCAARGNFFDERREMREVCAAEDEVVGTGIEEGFDFGADDLFGVGSGGFALFDEGDEFIGEGSEDGDGVGELGFSFVVEAAVEGASGCEDADDAAFRLERGGFDGGFDSDEGDVWMVGAQGFDGGGGGSVAGDDDHFAAAGEEGGGIGFAECDEVGSGAVAVGAVSGVGEVDGVFCRAEAFEGVEDAESAEARIEEANGSVIHGWKVWEVWSFWDLTPSLTKGFD